MAAIGKKLWKDVSSLAARRIKARDRLRWAAACWNLVKNAKGSWTVHNHARRTPCPAAERPDTAQRLRWSPRDIYPLQRGSPDKSQRTTVGRPKGVSCLFCAGQGLCFKRVQRAHPELQLAFGDGGECDSLSVRRNRRVLDHSAPRREYGKLHHIAGIRNAPEVGQHNHGHGEPQQRSCSQKDRLMPDSLRRRWQLVLREFRRVAALRQGNQERIPLSFALVITTEPRPQAAGFDPDDRINFRIEGRATAEHFHPDDGLLDLAPAPVERTQDDKAQEIARALCFGKGRAGQNPVELCSHPLRFHSRRTSLCSTYGPWRKGRPAKSKKCASRKVACAPGSRTINRE